MAKVYLLFFVLLSFSLSVRAESEPKDRVFELEKHTLEREDTMLHYWLAGAEDAPLIVFTHGAMMDHGMFTAQIGAFADGYRVLVWDVRGHGLSQPITHTLTMQQAAADLVALLDDVDVDQAVLVGQSMGGYISQYVYLNYPERVQAIAIIGATSIALPYSRVDLAALSASNLIIDLMPWPAFQQLSARNTAITPEAQTYALEAIQAISREDFDRIWPAVEDAISLEGLPGHAIDVPLLLTHGDQDNLGLIQAQAPLWAEIEDDVQYTVIPDAGHNANQDNAAYFNAVLRDWLTNTVFAGSDTR